MDIRTRQQNPTEVARPHLRCGCAGDAHSSRTYHAVYLADILN
jgi:hypothetical protein